MKEHGAGLSISGGRKDQFFFCLLEYFGDSKRWFLKSILQVEDEENLDGDEAIKTWIKKFELNQLFVEVPLTKPACSNCKISCPGQNYCPDQEVVDTRAQIEEILTKDQKIYENHHKSYERDRNSNDEFDYSRDVLAQESDHHILSRSFKRRLKKGYLPYWNRPLDFWVWKRYYDQLLEVFNHSYDSFGNASQMLLFRFSYLRHHFPENLELFETNCKLILIELLRKKLVTRRDLDLLSHVEEGIIARLNIVKAVEKGLGVFIYEEDLNTIVKSPRAFDSFILALSGVSLKRRESPLNDHFWVPSF